MAFNLAAWLRQPSTVIGLGAVAGALPLAANHKWAAAASVAISGVVAMVLPDNSAGATAATKLARDATQAALDQNVPAAMPTLLADGAALVSAMQPIVPTPPAPSGAPKGVTNA